MFWGDDTWGPWWRRTRAYCLLHKSGLMLFSCVNPIRDVGCWCKHFVAMFNVSLNTTLFSKCCLLVLCVCMCVWVNGKMGVRVLFTVLLFIFSHSLDSSSQCVCLSITYLFCLFLFICVASYFHFALPFFLLTRPNVHILCLRCRNRD